MYGLCVGMWVELPFSGKARGFLPDVASGEVTIEDELHKAAPALASILGESGRTGAGGKGETLVGGFDGRGELEGEPGDSDEVSAVGGIRWKSGERILRGAKRPGGDAGVHEACQRVCVAGVVPCGLLHCAEALQEGFADAETAQLTENLAVSAVALHITSTPLRCSFGAGDAERSSLACSPTSITSSGCPPFHLRHAHCQRLNVRAPPPGNSSSFAVKPLVKRIKL